MVSFSLFLCVHLALSQICASSSGWSWTVIGPSWLRPVLTPDPSSEEEVGTEGQTPFKPDELSDVTAAAR